MERKNPQDLLEIMGKKADEHPKELRKLLRGQSRADSASEDANIFEADKERTRYPKGLRPFSSDESLVELDEPWQPAVETYVSIDIIIKKEPHDESSWHVCTGRLLAL